MATIGVIGAGTMGAGIAQVAAAAGDDVLLSDVSDAVVKKGIAGIGQALDRLVEKGRLKPADKDKIVQRLKTAERPDQLGRCDLVIEAVAEKLEVKIEVLRKITPLAGPQTIFASNTSSLSISQIGTGIGQNSRMVGMHFFNPAPVMPLVEVIAGAECDPAVADQAAAYARKWGKTVVRAKDTPGFIVNRIVRGYFLEALRMLGEGMDGIGEIDRIMRDFGGFRMGPFELMDLVGIDINYAVSKSVWQQLGMPARLQPHPIQAGLFQSGQIGRKMKKGFYSYESATPAPAVSVECRPVHLPAPTLEAVEQFVTRATHKRGSPLEHYIFSRVLVTMINEAALALDEGVAGQEDINTAMRLGANHPRGPLEWADLIGRDRCSALLRAVNSEAEDKRFQPATSLAG